MDNDATVRMMLDLVGIRPAEDEIQEYIAGYPATREGLRSLYAMPSLPAADGILVFRATE
jgi:acetaldehyde dehydrogenase (acetylating)